MKAKRFKSGGSGGGGNDREDDRRSRAEIAARAAAANARVVPSSDSAPTSEQVSVNRTHVCQDYILHEWLVKMSTKFTCNSFHSEVIMS